MSDVLEVDATGVALTLAPNVSFAVANATATSPKFAGASAAVTDLAISKDGLAFGITKLHADRLTLAQQLAVKNFNLTVTSFSFQTANPTALLGTVAITADSAALFPGQTAFTAAVNGIAGNYDIPNAALHLSATNLAVKVGDIFELDAQGLGFNLTSNPAALTVSVQSAIAMTPKFGGVSAAVSNLVISDGGLSFDQLTLGLDTITLGSTLLVNKFALAVNNFNYQANLRRHRCRKLRGLRDPAGTLRTGAASRVRQGDRTDHL